MSLNAPELAVIGGGTGSFTLLNELKGFTPNLSAIVNMSDDGGSTGALRDELGVLPPGDVRQCLVALSNIPDVRDLFNYRFSDGRFDGHSLGNIILSGVELQNGGNFIKAVEIASRMLDITGRVIPATTDKHTLVMEDGDETIYGEYKIGHRQINSPDAFLRLEPPASVNPEAAEAICSADIVVIAPGNFYGSLLPIFAVGGIREAISASQAKIVSVTNLVTKPGQTDGWHVADYVKRLEMYIGVDQVDYVLYNNDSIPRNLLEKYAEEGEFPVNADEARFDEISASAIGAPLVAKEIISRDPSDKKIKRTLIRHDSRSVGRHLMQIFYK